MGERSGKFDLVTLQGDSDHLPSLATLQSGEVTGAGLSNISASNQPWRSWKLYIHGEGPCMVRGLLMVGAFFSIQL